MEVVLDIFFRGFRPDDSPKQNPSALPAWLASRMRGAAGLQRPSIRRQLGNVGLSAWGSGARLSACAVASAGE
jgi:hypothetical protein